MKLIHCSDLHLDSKMESNFTKEQAVERNYEVFLTFKRLISYAKENAVMAILIAGDMFDETRVSSTMIELVKSAMADAKDIDFLYLQGNHDEKAQVPSQLSELDNLKTFSGQWTCYDYNDVKVAGIELNRKNCEVFYDELNLDKEFINIVMLHGQESAQSGDGLVCLNKLRGKNINYLALGHLHSYKKEALDLDGDYCYSGCLEGRGFDECGEKGFVLLDIEEKKIRTTFVPFAQRYLHEIKTDITGLCTVNEILTAIEEKISGISEKDLIKITLCGTYLPETNKDKEFIKKALADRFYFVKIKDESKLFIDSKDYQFDKTLKGEFIRTVLGSVLDESDKERIIGCGLAALKGERIDL